MSGFGDMMMDDGFSDPMEYMDYLEEQYYNSQSDLYDNDDDWHDECAEKEYDKEEYEKTSISKLDVKSENEWEDDFPF